MLINPVFAENYVALIANCSNEYVPFLDVCLTSVEKNASKQHNYDIVVLESTISDKNKQRLIKRFSAPNFSLRFFNPTQIMPLESVHLSCPNYSKESYYKLIISLLFKNYDKIVYTDLDIVFECDVMELAQIDTKEYPLAMTRDFPIPYMCEYHTELRGHLLNSLGIDDCFEYFSAGLIIFNIKKITQQDVDSLLDLLKNGKYWMQEQDIFNKYYKGKIFEIPYKYCLNIPFMSKITSDFFKNRAYKSQWQDALRDPKVLHFSGDIKPWYSFNDNIYERRWWFFAKESQFYFFFIKHVWLDMLKCYRYKFSYKLSLGKKRKRYKKKYKNMKQRLLASKSF